MPGEIELRVDRSGRGASYYGFTCPSCLETVHKPADDRVIRLLISGGVRVLSLDPSTQERQRPLSERFEGPPITHDDILDFHALLQRDDWFSDLVALTAMSS
jgi:hypothetical protein